MGSVTAIDGVTDSESALIEDLLVRTSRTFALAIPELPQPTRWEVTLAYLLFRIADTFEDASVLWSRARRQAALADFARLLATPEVASAEELSLGWLREPPTDHDGYLELLRETPTVMRAVLGLSPEARGVVCEHTIRTSALMSSFVDRTTEEGRLELADLDELRAYCYAVAGIVGEVLTELFLLGRPHLASAGDVMRERAVEFGEGLQLVNILKDSASDADEGRFYLPTGIDRREVFALARRDLERAAEYVWAVQEAGGDAGIVSFTALPVELARATLERVEKSGPGAKIDRARVFQIYNQVQRAIRQGRPAVST